MGLGVSACTCLTLTPQVTQRIATCQPLSGALDNGRVILCDMVADPWVSAPQPIRARGCGGPHGRGSVSGALPRAYTPVLSLSSEGVPVPHTESAGGLGVQSGVGKRQCPGTVRLPRRLCCRTPSGSAWAGAPSS